MGHLLGRVVPAGVVGVPRDDTYILHTGADALDTIALSVGPLGLDFAVAEPPELVAYVRHLAERYRRATQRP